MGKIYKLENIQNGKVYIGQTTKSLSERFQGHVSAAKSGSNLKLSRAIRKYGEENFVIIEIDSAETKEELNLKEIYWIDFYDSLNSGYNMTLGGEGGNTYICKTDEELREIKNKISLANRGENNGNKGQYTGERNSMYGKHQSASAKKKISDSMTGHIFSKEHNEKISKFFKNRKKDYIPAVVLLYVYDTEGNVIERISAKEVVNKYKFPNYKELKRVVDNEQLWQNKYFISKKCIDYP